MLNRRGHIATTMLVLGALVLIVMTLFSFLSFKNDLERESGDFLKLAEKIDFVDEYIDVAFERIVDEAIDKADKGENFDKSFNRKFKEITLRRDLGRQDLKGFFESIQKGEYDLISDGNFYNLTISDLSLRVDHGRNEIERVYNLKVRFNEEGILK